MIFRKAIIGLVEKAACLGFILIIGLMGLIVVQDRWQGAGNGNSPGYKLMIVLSGSMQPVFDTGSVVVVKKVYPVDVKTGDIITYREGDGSGRLITHRVVEVLKREEGLSFVTKGDANLVCDYSPIPAGQVVGRVIFSLPYAGYLLGIFQNKISIIMLMVVPGLLVFFEQRSQRRKKWEHQREDTGLNDPAK